MNENELAKLEALVAAATPGPWRVRAPSCDDVDGDDSMARVVAAGLWLDARGELVTDPDVPGVVPCIVAMELIDEDAAFIAEARTAVRALIAEVRRLRQADLGVLSCGCVAD